MHRAVAEMVLMVPKELYVTQKLRAVDLIEVAKVPLCSEVEKKSKTIVVSSQGFFTLALLVLALKNSELGEPLKYPISNFHLTGFVLVLSDWNICVENFKIRLLSFLSVDCRIQVVAGRLPRTAPIGQRVPEKMGTCKISWSAPMSQIYFLVAPRFAFARLPIERDRHNASED